MPISAQDRADHWRGLAAEVLNAASGANDPQIRAVLLTIAALYEDLALRAELTNPISGNRCAAGSLDHAGRLTRQGSPAPTEFRQEW
jgi:hypothetical protein